MLAGVYKGNSLIQTDEIPTPNPGPNQIVVRVKYSAICGSDVHGWQFDAVAPAHKSDHGLCIPPSRRPAVRTPCREWRPLKRLWLGTSLL